MVHGLEEVYGQDVDFVYLNIDDPDTAPQKKELGYRYQPHIFIIDGNGEIVEQWVGNVSQEQLESALKEVSGS